MAAVLSQECAALYAAVQACAVCTEASMDAESSQDIGASGGEVLSTVQPYNKQDGCRTLLYMPCQSTVNTI